MLFNKAILKRIHRLFLDRLKEAFGSLFTPIPEYQTPIKYTEKPPTEKEALHTLQNIVTEYKTVSSSDVAALKAVSDQAAYYSSQNSGLFTRTNDFRVQQYLNYMNSIYGKEGGALDPVAGIENWSPFQYNAERVPNEGTEHYMGSESYGFKPEFTDPDIKNTQVNHFWFYVQLTYLYGGKVAAFGDSIHDAPGKDGASPQDRALTVKAIELGQLLKTGLIRPDQVSTWIANNIEQ